MINRHIIKGSINNVTAKVTSAPEDVILYYGDSVDKSITVCELMIYG